MYLIKFDVFNWNLDMRKLYNKVLGSVLFNFAIFLFLWVHVCKNILFRELNMAKCDWYLYACVYSVIAPNLPFLSFFFFKPKIVGQPTHQSPSSIPLNPFVYLEYLFSKLFLFRVYASFLKVVFLVLSPLVLSIFLKYTVLVYL